MNRVSLFSEHWHRVKDLYPRLASDVETREHEYRGVRCHVLQRRSGGRLHRVDAHIHAMLMRLNGTRSVEELWQWALERYGENAPEQPVMMSLLADLHNAGLLVVDRRFDAEHLFSRGEAQQRNDKRQRYLNPLFIRFALMDPEPWLERLDALAHRIFSRAAAVVWTLSVLLALMLLLPHWDALKVDIARLSQAVPAQVGLFFLVFPVMKAIHELAHALALRRYGCEVREVGVALMVLMPIPYVDASAASLLPDKHQRMIISGAGIAAELGMAALASVVWFHAGGLAQDIALQVMLIGSLSTVLFNANPLLRFDGYYVLSDQLEIPELDSRGKRYTLAFLRQRLFGEPLELPPVSDRREATWLLAYGTFSSLYRVVLMLTIALMLSQQYFTFGVLLALWVLFVLILRPTWRYIKWLFAESRAMHTRPLMVSAVLLLLGLTFLFTIPLPSSRSAAGVVWFPDNAIVRVDSDCEITQVEVQPGETVQQGMNLMRCENPELAIERRKLRARIAELDVERAALAMEDPVEAQRLQSERRLIDRRLVRIDEQIAAQTLQAGHSGRLVAAAESLLDGRFLRQGSEAAYVLPDRARVIRVALPQKDVDDIGASLKRVELHLAEHGSEVFTTEIERQTPKASLRVASAALTREGGGDLVADPDGDGTVVLDPVFDVQLAWPEVAPQVLVGSHVQVRFVREPQTLARRSMLALQRVLLSRGPV